jgi:hypothetical protein
MDLTNRTVGMDVQMINGHVTMANVSQKVGSVMVM